MQLAGLFRGIEMVFRGVRTGSCNVDLRSRCIYDIHVRAWYMVFPDGIAAKKRESRRKIIARVQIRSRVTKQKCWEKKDKLWIPCRFYISWEQRRGGEDASVVRFGSARGNFA